MNKRVIYNHFLALVCDAFDISCEDMVSKKRTEDISDARYALCHILSFQGISNSSVAEMMGLTCAGVSYLLERYEMRISQSTCFCNVIDYLRSKSKDSPFKVRMKSS